MKLNDNFLRELDRTANGDGSREAMLAFVTTAKKAVKELSTYKVVEKFDGILKRYGDAVVAVCVAKTIVENEERLSYRSIEWAKEVLRHWTNRPQNTDCVLIFDGLHPTRIENYADGLINKTMKEGGAVR